MNCIESFRVTFPGGIYSGSLNPISDSATFLVISGNDLFACICINVK
jgi:hypothetical protein